MIKKIVLISLIILLGRVDAFSQNQELKEIKTNPCKYGTMFKRLDFWLGDWDVYVKDAKIGTSSITKSDDGCTLYEDYKTFKGFLGRSMNYLDATDSLYTQIWIDKFNNKTIYKEIKSKIGYLQMGAKQNEKTFLRMTYLLDNSNGNVTQTMESSTDKGKEWKVIFLGIYKKKEGL